MYVFSQIQRKIILIRKEKLKKANKKPLLSKWSGKQL